jgi:hypothetical protein
MRGKVTVGNDFGCVQVGHALTKIRISSLAPMLFLGSLIHRYDALHQTVLKFPVHGQRGLFH